ncbi:MAG: phenylalanine--tRNA ligase subunit beta [Acidobacteriota bacterium]
MKFSHAWLQDFVDLEGLEISDIAHALTMTGFPVEGIEHRGEDTVLDLEITTNRSDCLNHLGLARELAAIFRRDLTKPDLSAPGQEKSVPDYPAGVVIESPELCPRYTARVLTGVEIKESPGWLKERLEAVGQRPINNIVDITNYVLLELGHPLHAFDYDLLRENRIIVRTAREAETITTLDGIKRPAGPSMLMICDAEKPVAVAGVMGGEDTEVSSRTKTILLESAYFDPSSIRSTARNLAMRTEASYRFERGADPEMPEKALNRACRLILEIAGGKAAGPVIDEYPNKQLPRRLQLRAERLRKVTGVSFDHEFLTDLLSRLEFEVSSANAQDLQVQVPSFRSDVGIEDDLVEEVARHYGYERIENTYPAAPVPGKFLPTYSHERRLTRTLRGLGFFEAVNYVFRTPDREAHFYQKPPAMVPISNPLTEEDTHLRTDLIPGLVEAVRRNLNHGTQDVRLFEVGHVFVPGSSGRVEDYEEQTRLGLIATGRFYDPHWRDIRDQFDFYHLKGVMESLLEDFGLHSEYRRLGDHPLLHPGAAAEIWAEGTLLGCIGEFHPRLSQSWKFLQRVYVCEIGLGSVYERALAEPCYSLLEKFPSVERDLSFVIDKSVEYDKIAGAIEGLNIPELQKVQVIDLYHGTKLPVDKVSLTVRLTFAHPERTLTQEEVSQYSDNAFSALRSQFAAEGRS